jgi:hypothetical protein
MAQQHADYQPNLEAAREFEDYVSDVLNDRLGLVVYVYRSRRYQSSKGESRCGLEIKFDRKFRDTGNLFIETAERWSEDVAMKPAGIYGSNWLYAIGDYTTFWVFGTAILRLHQEACEAKKTDTAEGFVLALDKADKWCLHKIEAGSGEKRPQVVKKKPEQPKAATIDVMTQPYGNDMMIPF